jgi:thymidine phosphorylase
MPRHAHQEPNILRLRRLGIDTYREPVIYMTADCPVCRSEGWTAEPRIQVSCHGRSIIATLNVVTGALLTPEEASLSEIGWQMLDARDGDLISLEHPAPVESLSHIRAKVFGHPLSDAAIKTVVGDIVAGRYSAIELAAFVTAFAGGRLNLDELVSLTRAMTSAGQRLYWGHAPIVDKHCVGGLPGNRTTMIIVPVVAAYGLTIPKTSSRAITSPAGTADTMETVAPVALELAAIRRVVEREGACIVWGGAVQLSPADDVIISVERPLDLDSNDQLVASILSKKLAAGSTHVLIDVPLGPSAKVRSTEAADALERLLCTVGTAIGLQVRVARTDGRQPVGRGVGPSLEARDVLAVLRREATAPADLRERALALAGEIIELGGTTPAGAGKAVATRLLESGAALAKFEAICEAQGGMREPARAKHVHVVDATRAGVVAAFDNRRLARIAKLAGAPRAPTAGLEVHARLGTRLDAGDPLITIHAETPGELDYARAYLRANPQIISLDGSA